MSTAFAGSDGGSESSVIVVVVAPTDLLPAASFKHTDTALLPSTAFNVSVNADTNGAYVAAAHDPIAGPAPSTVATAIATVSFDAPLMATLTTRDGASNDT